MKTSIGLLAGALLVLAAAATAPAMAATKISLLYSPGAPVTSCFVAKDQGIFAKHGLDVDLTMAQNGSVMISALVAGSAQVGVPTAPVFVQALDNGIDVVALASTNTFPDKGGAGLVVAADSGIKSVKDLVGKTVAVPGFGGILDIILRKWIADNGVDVAKVHFVEFQLSQGLDILKAHQVDAIALVDPFFTPAVKTGVGRSLGNYIQSMPDGAVGAMYTATADWVKDHPEAAKAFHAAIAEAATYALGHESQAKASLAKYTHLPKPVVDSLVMPSLTAAITAKQIQYWVDLGNKQGFAHGHPDISKALLH